MVFRNELLELIQYKPVTESVHERPLLVVPPQINKFYVFDLSPDKSLARFLLRSQVQTFVVSWRNPTKAQREWGLSTYIDALKEFWTAQANLEAALGAEAEKIMRPMQPGDVTATYADISKLNALCGYQPKAPLKIGLEKFVAWWRQYQNG